MYINCFPTVNNSFSQYQQCVTIHAFRQNEEGGGGGSGSTSSG